MGILRDYAEARVDAQQAGNPTFPWPTQPASAGYNSIDAQTAGLQLS